MGHHLLLSAASAVVTGLLVGLALLGAVVCLAALRLSNGWGLLTLAASTATGLLALAVWAGQGRAEGAG